ncbi:MAG: cofactor-independent phosphoglycerate mutase [Planctomycetia bacterium]|nr:cofactor-independent phosphoglycerate mutase [Planctomycetia bacterium]
MKYIMILPDGCADEPIPALGNKTIFEAARIPNMTEIARQGIVGWSNNTPSNLAAGSDVATMSLLGYDPQKYYTGRAPLEAAALGIELGPEDWAIRCNLVTVENGKMVSFNADQISSEEGAELLHTAQEKLGSDVLTFFPGVSYRNIVRWRSTPENPAPLGNTTRTYAPHDYTDKSVFAVHPAGPGSVELVSLMAEVHKIFADHPVNKKRISAGKHPATDVWLWGQGRKPSMPTFTERFGKTGAMITAVDLLRGLAVILGWDRIDVDGATGLYTTNFRGKGEAAIRALENYDVVCVHVEATDEAGHDGSPETKVYSLEQIDEHIVGPLHEAAKKYGEYRILITPDHPTPCRLKTHTHNNVPWLMAGTGLQPNDIGIYSEAAAARSEINFPKGSDMMEFFMK